MDTDGNGKKKIEPIFKLLDKHRKIVPFLFIAGIIGLMESIVFIYSTMNGSFNHLPLWALWLTFIISSADSLIIMIYLKNRSEQRDEEPVGDMAPYLKRIDDYIPLKNPLISVSVGLLLIIFSFEHYLIGVGTENIGDADLMFMLLGLLTVAYPFIPEKYSLERDFILTFLGFLVVFMSVVPFLFSFGEEGFTYYFLTYPVHYMLNAIGIVNHISSSNRISFPHNGVWGTIIIARSCSGIYSFSIFSASFIAFVLVVYRKIDLKAGTFMILGILLAYIGNIIRMTVVIASGYYYGHETMTWVHENVGYLIFFIWMGFFWFILYRVLMKGKK